MDNKMMPTTRPKRKRTGCLGCRIRRKRCSEERPQCVNCVRNGILCTWPELGNEQHDELLRRTNLTHRRVKAIGPPSAATSPASSLPGSTPCASELDHSDDIAEPLRLVPPSLDPLMLIGNLRLPTSRRLFHHYLHKTNKVMATCRATSNPFVAELIPMAMGTDLILHGLLACSGIHYAELLDAPVNETTWYHYGQAIQAQKFGLTRLAQGQDDVVIPLLVTAVLLCITETFRASSGTLALHHLKAARALIQKALEIPAAQLSKEIRAFLIERYAYTMVLAHISMGVESDEWVLHDAATLFPMVLASGSSGCVHELFQVIPRVSILAREMENKRPGQVPSASLTAEYWQLRSIVSGWQPDSDDETHNLCGRLYQQALLIFLASCSQDTQDAGTGYSEEVQECFDAFIPFLESVPPESPISTTLCWPLAVFGSYAQTAEHLTVIANRLDVLSSVYSARSVRDTKSLLEKLWKIPNRTGPSCLERIMKEESKAVLFF